MTTSSQTRALSLFGLDPATYVPHELHGATRTYPETNCYTDILIELLHARGDEPLAGMGSIVRLDFEGDQWTFFKPPVEDLERLFGIDIHEMQPYRHLPTQIAEQIVEGRTIIVEVDAWYLPDTAATSYRREHVKTSIAPESIDEEQRRLTYFHNMSLHELEGDDYRGVFRIGGRFTEDVLPPYAELVRFDAGERLVDPDELRWAARSILRGHLAHRPAVNPFRRFSHRLVCDLPELLSGDQAGYHAYAFATVRMAGAGFELCSAHIEWLLGESGAGVSAELGRIVDGCKLLSLKLARRRHFDPTPVLDELAEAWERAMQELDRLV